MPEWLLVIIAIPVVLLVGWFLTAWERIVFPGNQERQTKSDDSQKPKQ